MAAKLRELESVPLGGASSAYPVASQSAGGALAGEMVSYARLRKMVENALLRGWEVQIDETAISSIEVLDGLVHHAGVTVTHVWVQDKPSLQMKIDCSW